MSLSRERRTWLHFTRSEKAIGAPSRANAGATLVCKWPSARRHPWAQGRIFHGRSTGRRRTASVGRQRGAGTETLRGSFESAKPRCAATHALRPVSKHDDTMLQAQCRTRCIRKCGARPSRFSSSRPSGVAPASSRARRMPLHVEARHPTRRRALHSPVSPEEAEAIGFQHGAAEVRPVRRLFAPPHGAVSFGRVPNALSVQTLST